MKGCSNCSPTRVSPSRLNRTKVKLKLQRYRKGRALTINKFSYIYILTHHVKQQTWFGRWCRKQKVDLSDRAGRFALGKVQERVDAKVSHRLNLAQIAGKAGQTLAPEARPQVHAGSSIQAGIGQTWWGIDATRVDPTLGVWWWGQTY